MKVLNSSKGLGGQLADFRKLVEGSEKISFIGTPGFCTPFAELMSYVLRNSGKELAFVSNLDTSVARSITMKDLGMQLGDEVDPSADTIVLMGGLAIPKMGIDPKAINEVVEKLLEGAENKLIIGFCFQSVFQEQKWPEYIDFDYILDSDLSVTVMEV